MFLNFNSKVIIFYSRSSSSHEFDRNLNGDFVSVKREKPEERRDVPRRDEDADNDDDDELNDCDDDNSNQDQNHRRRREKPN
jgi:hypothetical protein